MERKPVGSPSPAQSPLPVYQRHQSLPETYGGPSIQQNQQPHSTYDHRSQSSPITNQQPDYNEQQQYALHQGFQENRGYEHFPHPTSDVKQQPQLQPNYMQHGYPPAGPQIVYMQAPPPVVDQKGHPQNGVVYMQGLPPGQQQGGVVYMQAPAAPGQAQSQVIVMQQQSGGGGCGACLGGAAGGCCGACAACCCCTVM